MEGIDVKFTPRVVKGRDQYGNEVEGSGEPFTLHGVVVVPEDPGFPDGEGRPNGATVAYDLYLWLEEDVSLRGAKAELFGDVYDVVGDPRPYPNTPRRMERNAKVKVARTYG